MMYTFSMPEKIVNNEEVVAEKIEEKKPGFVVNLAGWLLLIDGIFGLFGALPLLLLGGLGNLD